MPNNKLPEKVKARASLEFERALNLSVPVEEVGQMGLFSDEDEAYIRKEVERMLYEPALPNAGDLERKYIERLERLAQNREWAHSGEAYALAQQFKLLLPFGGAEHGTSVPHWEAAGCYYTSKPVTWKTDKARYEKLMFMMDVNGDDADKQWYARLLLNKLGGNRTTGWPEAVSNFKIECLYLLRMPDGAIERRVRLRNIKGEVSGEVNLDSEAFASPEKFRRWGLGHGNFAWSGNQTDLQALHVDICAEAAWKVINLVVTMGWYPLSSKKSRAMDGVFFMGDCAYRDGTMLEVSDGGFYEIAARPAELGPGDGGDGDGEGEEKERPIPVEGYQIADHGRENAFFHKKPLMRPHERITGMKLKFTERFDVVPLSEKPTETELTGRFFRELCCRLKNICGESANLIVGAFAAYAAGPEIFAKHSLFPGLWIHGSQNSGKSTLLEWMMEFWGYSLHAGIILRGNNSTATGLLQALDQYSNLPVWLDEFRAAEVQDDKRAVIHNSYNRGDQAKFNMSKLQRSVKTAFVISGESTTGDSALRGRFPHVQVAKSMRAGTQEEQDENFNWFTKHREKFFVFGRFLLENRSEFVRLVFKYLDSWNKEEIDPRLKITHGVGWSAWMAMNEMFGVVMTAQELTTFKRWLVEHSKAASEDVVSETNVNLFWTDLIPAVKARQIPRTCFKVVADYCACPPGAVNLGLDGQLVQKGWKSCRLYIEPDSTLMHLSIWLAKTRQNVVLKRKDLRDQLSKEDYWIDGGRFGLRQRFMGASVPAWGIDADKHPLGYQPCTDAEYLAYRENPIEGDPRKGPLFEIIDWWLAESNKEPDPDAAK